MGLFNYCMCMCVCVCVCEGRGHAYCSCLSAVAMVTAILWPLDTHAYLKWFDDIGCVWWPHNEGMVTALLQLHDEVDKACDASLHSLAQCLVVLGQYPAAARREDT